MSQLPVDIANHILREQASSPHTQFTAFAPVNIALCKYWGKRDQPLNLPINDSLSVSLDTLGTTTTIRYAENEKTDTIFLNDEKVAAGAPFYQRVISHLSLFRPFLPRGVFQIDTHNNIATAAGLASSASGFAALTKALAGLGGFDLSLQQLSILARLGSGSACRSVHTGFVRWHKGNASDGMDSYATPLTATWPGLCVGLLTLKSSEKAVSSRAGMQRTVENCVLYQSWPSQALRDIALLQQAIETHDFVKLGEVSEQNAMAMHATMIASSPPLLYWQPQTITVMQKVWQLRKQGIAVYLTMDAGPNVKLLFENNQRSQIQKAFSNIQVVQPFA